MTPRRLPALLALAFAAFYAATTRGTFVYGDDILMFLVTEALVDRAEVAVEAPLPEKDAPHGIPGPDGRLYAKYAPGLSVAAVPFYAAGAALERSELALPVARDAWGLERAGTRVFAVGLTNALLGGLAVGAFAWTLLRAGFAAGTAALAALLVGLATPLAHAAASFLSEPLAALGFALAAAGTAAVARPRAEAGAPRGALVLAGAGASVAVAAKLAHAVALPILALAVVCALGGRRAGGGRLARALALWAAPVLATLAALAAYNRVRFGSLLETGYGEEASSFTRPLHEGLFGLLASPGRGLIWYAPPVLLAVFGFRALWRRSPALAVLASGVPCALLLLYAKYYQWHGGGSWGPRFLVPAIPLLLLPVAALRERTPRAAAVRTLLFATGFAGAIVTALGVLVPFARHAPGARPRLNTPAYIARLWTIEESPIWLHAREAPASLATTARMLAGREPLPGPEEKQRVDLPDLAFAHYGSHALLEWTRGALVVALGAGVCAGYLVRRERGGSAAAASQ